MDKNTTMTLNQNQLFNAQETLEDFKVLVTRYNQVKNDETKLRAFFVRNRNPLWDLTGCKFYKTGLLSEGAKKLDKTDLVDDHYIQRAFSMKIIFNLLCENPNMGVDEFILLIKKYSSTISITKDEHKKITSLTKNSNEINYHVYDKIGILVPGLLEHINVKLHTN